MSPAAGGGGASGPTFCSRVLGHPEPEGARPEEEISVVPERLLACLPDRIGASRNGAARSAVARGG
jgi:hypothetical protein